ncbi:hypothetical protein PM3016_3192 [Paenibacillus mucilaginosus 3016]|uniref:Uncharacterized protein n=1 Tax=Paenibacillus mucilaginosus 3016 TaxID=1116391 RepID=H6NFG1_9BACL|nr:hypothetical protein [Paenibacillus mucilaginosus]AFC30047.1 hypothetical protein PM3016_3192 [Paenibacillus mucilaginosus 3016]WFA18701.1 hypothetical protein ERY13_16160 [Paenibacillus mucilaginosus]
MEGQNRLCHKRKVKGFTRLYAKLVKQLGRDGVPALRSRRSTLKFPKGSSEGGTEVQAISDEGTSTKNTTGTSKNFAPKWYTCRSSAFLQDEAGAVSTYLILIFIPVFLLCGLLIDVVRWKTAQKEAENAVKAGVRSSMSAFSPALQAYGLYGLPEESKAGDIFTRTVQGNLSAPGDTGGFRFVDQHMVEGSAKVTPMYSLANHEQLKGQILEEMKYRAPLIFSLELSDKLKKTGVAGNLGQAAQFTENAAKIEKLLNERDAKLGEAWDQFLRIRQMSLDAHPFYTAQLRDLNELSGRIGLHTLDEVRQSLQNVKTEIASLKSQISSINSSIAALAMAGPAAAQSISALIQEKQALQDQVTEAMGRMADLEALLQDILRYAQLIAVLKVKAQKDYDDLSQRKDGFLAAMKAGKAANDQLNAELGTVSGASGGGGTSSGSEAVYASVQRFDRQELDTWEAGVSAAVSLFAGVNAQIGDGLMFTQQKYATTTAGLDGFHQQVGTLYTKHQASQEERIGRNQRVEAAKREERTKTGVVLDKVKRGIGGCSIMSGVDPHEAQYHSLLGNPAAAGDTGFYGAYMALNQAGSPDTSVPSVDLDSADGAGLSALKLFSSLGDMLGEVRDEFYIDEFAVSRFSYRTLGLHKDPHGRVIVSKELSQPEQHPLTNQEVEFLLYGARSCAGNYSLAYAELFAFRLAVGTAEALTEPRNEALAAGSPMLVVLAAVTEGALRAQDDLEKLIHGEAVPLSRKFTNNLLTLYYKDYLRIFLLMHSREPVLLSRIQALLQLNTELDLASANTYISGRATTSLRLWFLPSIMKTLGRTEFGGCVPDGNRCELMQTADFAY